MSTSIVVGYVISLAEFLFSMIAVSLDDVAAFIAQQCGRSKNEPVPCSQHSKCHATVARSVPRSFYVWPPSVRIVPRSLEFSDNS